MGIKKGDAPKSFPAVLEITSAGESFKFPLRYHNRKASELDAKESEVRESNQPYLAAMAFFLVESWETDYPLSIDGMAELEDERPGMSSAIISGFHQTRLAKLAGN